MLLTDRQIVELIQRLDLLHPFDIRCLNSCGYDLRLGEDFKLPILDTEYQVIDPFNPHPFMDKRFTDYIIIPSHSFVLGRSIEYVKMPNNVLGVCLGRSTYARAGVVSHVTPLEPGWEGVVTIEISNTNPLPVKVWVGKGITQVVFFKTDEMPEMTYVTKGGRYQGQMGVTQGRPQ